MFASLSETISDRLNLNSDQNQRSRVTDPVAVLNRPHPPESATWHDALSAATRDSDVLLRRLNLPPDLLQSAREAAAQFPVMVPESYLRRIKPGDPRDPLLLQVLPLKSETDEVPGFVDDAVNDLGSRTAPGLLHKYHGRALMIMTGACAIHCRYCFRRHYPYSDEPKTLAQWTPAIQAIAADTSIHEVLLSGGDPLMLKDQRLQEFIQMLSAIPHLRRLRIHSRLPIVLPDRVTDRLVKVLTSSRLTPFMVIHANHPHELTGDCADSVRKLVRSGITTLNQAVLLRGINDTVEIQQELCERLIDLGVIPYYLNQLDRVRGTAHFEVDDATGIQIIAELRRRLPGYAVPQFVRDEPGWGHKRRLDSMASPST